MIPARRGDRVTFAQQPPSPTGVAQQRPRELCAVYEGRLLERKVRPSPSDQPVPRHPAVEHQLVGGLRPELDTDYLPLILDARQELAAAGAVLGEPVPRRDPAELLRPSPAHPAGGQPIILVGTV